MPISNKMLNWTWTDCSLGFLGTVLENIPWKLSVNKKLFLLQFLPLCSHFVIFRMIHLVVYNFTDGIGMLYVYSHAGVWRKCVFVVVFWLQVCDAFKITKYLTASSDSGGVCFYVLRIKSMC